MTMIRRSVVVVPLALSVLLAACTTSVSDQATAGGSPAATPSPTSVQPGGSNLPGASPSRTIVRVSPPAVATSSVPPSLLAEVVADAAVRTQLDPAQITVERAQAMSWPNSALGCPVPGHDYTDALVSGYWIVVRGGDERLDYRATQQGAFGLCENPPGPG
jgi:hypothetical protein